VKNERKFIVAPGKGFSYDLLSSEVLVDRLTVKDGRLFFRRMSYKMLVVDLDEPSSC
jgi:hypothetical protein